MNDENKDSVVNKDNEDDYVYTWDIDEIAKDAEQYMERGILPGIADEALISDIKHYVKEMRRAAEEDDEEGFIMNKAEAVRKRIEQNRRKASTKDILIIKLTDEQKQQIRDDVSSSYVRNNHNLRYHKLDEELYDSQEKKEIYSKLSKLQSSYYNAPEWIAAMKVIMEAVEYSLKNDYPWYSHDQVVQMWNTGKIQLKLNIPKLYTNWTTYITNPQTLKGIFSGEITVASANDRNKKKSPAKERRYKTEPIPMHYDYQVTSPEEFAQMQQLHRQGYNTPLSPVLKSIAGTFNRFSLPENNYFYTMQEQKERRPDSFDWMEDGAGRKFYNLVNNVKTDTYDIIDYIGEKNNNNINPAFRSNIDPFLKSLSNPETPNQTLIDFSNAPSAIETATSQEIALENSIMKQMMVVTPNDVNV